MIVPARNAPAFAATEYAIMPSPVPLAPELIVIQLSLDTAVQSQLDVTAMLSLTPAGENVRLVGEMEKLQPAS